jgi:hypothetical protein
MCFCTSLIGWLRWADAFATFWTVPWERLPEKDVHYAASLPSCARLDGRDARPHTSISLMNAS